MTCAWLAGRGIRRLFGWKRVPDPSTFGRWLRRGGERLARQLDSLLWQVVRARWAVVGVPSAVMLVLDSTVVQRYGLQQTGPRTAELVQRILDSRPHPEQGYRACLGLLRLGERYGPPRLEAACARALQVGAISYQSVKSILSTRLDQLPLEEQTALALPQNHEHVRGGEYYAAAAAGE